LTADGADSILKVRAIPERGWNVAAAKKRELFEVFQPSDREPGKGDASSTPSTPSPPSPPPTPPSPPPIAPQKRTLWEEKASARPAQITFTLSRGTLLFAGIVFVLIIAIAYALGQRSGRLSAASEDLIMRDETPSRLPTTPVATREIRPTVSAIKSGYIVQLISYGKKTKSGMADELIKALQGAGYRAYTRESEKDIGVCAGLFATWEKAEEAKKWFATNKVGGIGPFEDPMVYPYTEE